MGLRTRRDVLVRRLGEGADEPSTATAVVGATAFVFSGLYYGTMAIGHRDAVAVGRYESVVALGVLFLLTVVNAAVVTWAVWRTFGFSGTWGYRRGAGAGFVVGLLSHLSLGVLVATVWLPRYAETTGVSTTVLRWLGASAGVAFFSVVFTAGVPILLSVGSSVGLTYCRKRVAAD